MVHRLKLVTALVVVLVLAVGMGWVIGAQIGDRRASDRARHRVERQVERQRAIDAAELRREREEERKEREEERKEREAEAPDEVFDDATRQLLQAAKRGRRDAVARQETRLSELVRRRAATDQGPAAEDPYERELDRFPIGQPPLVAQQISSSDDHVLFVSVFTAHFCLKSPSERRDAVRETYQPIARRLHKQRVDDFELLVVPLSSTAPRRSSALARAAGGSVSLTSLGQSC